MSDIKISSWLLEKIKTGESILFLGAGATIGSKDSSGKTSPTGDALRDMISDKFLGGLKKNSPLNRVADYAKNESSLFEVQIFIKEQFEDLEPASFHQIIPKFRWHAIFSTNYDQVIEKAYDY